MGIDQGPTEYVISRKHTRHMNMAIEAFAARIHGEPEVIGRPDVPADVQQEFATLYAAWDKMREEINEQNRQAQEQDTRRLEATR